jgi:hypothetical protein
MIFSSYLVKYISIEDVNNTYEVFTNNFCAGMLIGAIIDDLFPFLEDNNLYSIYKLIAILIGFLLLIILINIIDIYFYLKEFFYSFISNSTNNNNNNENISLNTKEHLYTELELPHTNIELEYDQESIDRSTRYISNPKHKNHIKNLFIKLNESIEGISKKVNILFENNDLQIFPLYLAEELTESNIYLLYIYLLYIYYIFLYKYSYIYINI